MKRDVKIFSEMPAVAPLAKYYERYPGETIKRVSDIETSLIPVLDTPPDLSVRDGSITLTNGWTENDAVNEPVRVYVENVNGRSWVMVYGLVNTEPATAGQIFYLPEGYRPRYDIRHRPVYFNGATAAPNARDVTVSNDGAVTANAAFVGDVGGQLSLDGIRFLAED